MRGPRGYKFNFPAYDIGACFRYRDLRLAYTFKGAHEMSQKSGWMSLIVLSLAMACLADDTPNTLSETEKAEGWKLLFDGKTLNRWHSFKEKAPLPAWTVKDGVLTLTPDKAHHNPGLVSEEAFENFELRVEWRISPGGNSGIFYRIAEEGGDLNWTGIEYQVIDNKAHADAKIDPNRTTAAAYYMYPPSKDATRPVGEWNQTRIVLKGNHVEHWLNSEKVVEYEIGSEDWLKRYAVSKFKTHLKYGRTTQGQIALQEHGDAAEFRNIKIKVLSEK
jgi:hypothetical protein